MTMEEQVYQLAMTLDDPAFETYHPSQLIWALNGGQDLTIKKVKSHILPQIHILDEEVTVDATGAIVITGSSTDLSDTIFAFPVGLLGIRLTDGKFCKRKSFQEYRDEQNLVLTYSTYKPICYLRGTKAFIQPYTASTTTVDVHYKREPVQIAEAVGETAAVDCEFTDLELLRVINEFARFLIYDLKKDTYDLAQDSYVKAILKVDEINLGFTATETIEYGNDVDYMDEYSDFPITPTYDFPEV